MMRPMRNDMIAPFFYFVLVTFADYILAQTILAADCADYADGSRLLAAHQANSANAGIHVIRAVRGSLLMFDALRYS